MTSSPKEETVNDWLWTPICFSANTTLRLNGLVQANNNQSQNATLASQPSTPALSNGSISEGSASDSSCPAGSTVIEEMQFTSDSMGSTPRVGYGTSVSSNAIPSLDSVMAIQDPDKQRAQVKVLFSSLAESTALPKGEFRGDFVGLYTESAIAKALVPWLWEGVEFDGPQATLSLNSWVSWFLPQETGTVSLAESVYDGRQTIRVDYEDRFWETRRLDDNRYLSIVTNKETKKIGDVHTLTVTR